MNNIKRQKFERITTKLFYFLLSFRPSNSQPEEVVSYSPHREENTLKDINNGDDNEHKNNNVIARTTASKENFEQTSNNLSKLADKLNAGTSKPASGIPSKIPPKPAFRRKGSSNIAKLTSGKGSGATQIHGQTPYMKSPRIDSKPPLGATKNGTEAHTNVKSRLVRTSAISSGIGRGFIQKEDDKEADNANETFSMPLKKQRGLLLFDVIRFRSEFYMLNASLCCMHTLIRNCSVYH